MRASYGEGKRFFRVLARMRQGVVKMAQER
jgi:hypothetical protein